MEYPTPAAVRKTSSRELAILYAFLQIRVAVTDADCVRLCYRDAVPLRFDDGDTLESLQLVRYGMQRERPIRMSLAARASKMASARSPPRLIFSCPICRQTIPSPNLRLVTNLVGSLDVISEPLAEAWDFCRSFASACHFTSLRNVFASITYPGVRQSTYYHVQETSHVP